ncbi:TetR/AcrR family transcriptional regulator [Nocardia suismassiliense]|uniref:TetR/AcrR family transcriptional regulator n=1 Tax=Nocardia suismassiliense TaxID=2077092 RepID=UPI001F4089A8|nr:TetR/AcrR family transcriptional regulator [Nocardia suismassiliense]
MSDTFEELHCDALVAMDISVLDRRTELLRTAARMFAQRGFEATTIRDIGAAAGLLPGGVCCHFESKDAMVGEILREFLEDLFGRYSDIKVSGFDPVETLRLVLAASFESIFTHHDAVVIYQAEAAQLSARSAKFAYLDDYELEFHRNWTELLWGGIALGLLRADLDVDMTYKYLRDAVWSAVRWYRPGCGRSPKELSDKYFQLALHGVGRSHR